MNIEEQVNHLVEKVSEMNLEILSLKEEIKRIKSSEYITGTYLDGCDDYVAEYIKNEQKEGVTNE